MLRGFEVDDDARHRIVACTEPNLLRAWHVRALRAAEGTNVAEILT